MVRTTREKFLHGWFRDSEKEPEKNSSDSHVKTTKMGPQPDGPDPATASTIVSRLSLESAHVYV